MFEQLGYASPAASVAERDEPEDAIPPQCICLGRPDKAAYAEGLLKQMRKFWQEGALCDALLVSADGTEFPVHRLILASGSDELGALVNGQFAEGDQVRKGEPVKVEVPSNVLLAVLEFIYGAEPVITIETGLELLPVAHRLGLMRLVELLEPAIGPSLQPWSVATSLILSQDLGLRQLHTRCELFLANNLEECSKAESFGKLSAAQLGRILRREDLKVDREETVLEAVLRWHQCMERGRDAGALLQHVDFGSMSRLSLKELFRLSESLGSFGKDLQVEIEEGLKGHVSDMRWRPRRRCLRHWWPDLGAKRQSHHIVAGGPQPGEGPDQLGVHHHLSSIVYHGGSLYIGDMTNGRLVKWPIGAKQGEILLQESNNRQQLCVETFAVGRDGTCYLMDPEKSVWSVKDGQCVRVFEAKEKNRLEGFEGGNFPGIVDLKCSPAGELYVCDKGRTRIQKVNNKELIPMTPSSKTSLSFHAWTFVISQDDSIYISDAAGDRILKFSGQGNGIVVVDCAAVGIRPTDMALHGNDVYISDMQRGSIWKKCSDEAALMEIANPANHGGIFRIDVDPVDGALFILHGSTVSQWGPPPKFRCDHLLAMGLCFAQNWSRPFRCWSGRVGTLESAPGTTTCEHIQRARQKGKCL